MKLKLKLNSENNTNNESISSKNKENILDNEKNIITHFNNFYSSTKEGLKSFNNNNNKKNNLPLVKRNSLPLVQKDFPKKLNSNPNLNDKEEKIKIITEKEKVKYQKRNSCNTNKEFDMKESKLKEFFFGGQKEKVEKEKIVEEKQKRASIPIKPNITNDIKMNNFISKIDPKKKAKERSSSAINFIHSLKNPKSQYEQEEEKQKK